MIDESIHLLDPPANIHQMLALPKKCLYSELFWSTYSRIWTEYGEGALLYYKLGKTCLQIGVTQLLQILASAITNWD